MLGRNKKEIPKPYTRKTDPCMVAWDNGSGLNVIPEEDEIEIISDK
jgi:hypothetical protein